MASAAAAEVGPRATKKQRLSVNAKATDGEVGAASVAASTEWDPEAEIKSSGLGRREPIFVQESDQYSSDKFLIPNHYKDYVQSVLLPAGTMRDRVAKLAADIREDYGTSTPHLICVLKGAAEFFGDLTRALRYNHQYFPSAEAPYTFDYIRVKSYEGTESTGRVDIIGGDLQSVRGRHVVIVEDIIDSGLTMTKLIPALRRLAPRSIKVASLLEKRTTRSCGFKADYVGFSVPDVFIVGYNMDYNEIFRDLPHLCIMNLKGVAKFKVPSTPRTTPQKGALARPGQRMPSFDLGHAAGGGAGGAAGAAESSSTSSSNGAGDGSKKEKA